MPAGPCPEHQRGVIAVDAELGGHSGRAHRARSSPSAGGRHSKPFQYACYGFYPGHMLLLALALRLVNR